MACSNCGGTDHNVQRCPTVRRCGHCNRPGHDRRNCPRLNPPRPTPLPAPAIPPRSCVTTPQPPSPQFAELREHCATDPSLLAHLYWPGRHSFFEQSRNAHTLGYSWRMKATPNHGVHSPPRPTVNFFVADLAWLDAYTIAAATRNLRHGLLVRHTSIETLANRPGYDLEKVNVGHPHKFGVHDHAEFWRFDLGNHRFKALDTLRFATVLRLATPEAEDSRFIDVPHDAVVMWW